MSLNAPNYTQVPNALFALMPDMGNAELKVVLAVCRQTIGWHKTKDRLTITRLAELTGLSRQSVYEGISQAIERGILIQEDCKELGYVYSLDIAEPEAECQETRQTVSSNLTESVKKVDTQKKERKKEISPAAANGNSPIGNETQNPFKVWESVGLVLTAYISEQLQELEKEYSSAWVCEAIRRAASQNKRNLNYVIGILKRWNDAGGMDYPVRDEKIVRTPTQSANTAPQWIQT